LIRNSDASSTVLIIGRSAAGERNEERLYAMVWSAGADPRLMDSAHFRTESELCDWLRGLNGAWMLRVSWSKDLMADDSLRDAVVRALDGKAPAPPEPL
jgi:hypothetical protein